MGNHTCATCTTGEAPYLERVRYFPGQLMTSDDFIQEQAYERARMRRHNRMLHGWGVVCGAWVTAKQPSEEDPRTSVVVVSPGYLLSPYGDEIVIDEPVEVDVVSEDLDGNAVPCGGVADPWCANVTVQRRADEDVYLAVKYAECPTRPVRAYPGGCGCGCGGADCEYSRIRDSFVVKVLTTLPTSHDPMPGKAYPEFEGSLYCDERDPARPCPPCPPDPWVVLATIRMSGSSEVGFVDCTARRRYAAAFGRYYYRCGSTGGGGSDVAPSTVLTGAEPAAGPAEVAEKAEPAGPVDPAYPDAPGKPNAPDAPGKKAAATRRPARRTAKKTG